MDRRAIRLQRVGHNQSDSAPMQAEGTQLSQKNIHIPRWKEERGTGWEWPAAPRSSASPVNQEVRRAGEGGAEEGERDTWSILSGASESELALLGLRKSFLTGSACVIWETPTCILTEGN